MDVRGNVIVLYNWTLGYNAVSNWIANHKQPISHTNPTLTLTLKTLQRTTAPLNKSSLLYNLYLVGADFSKRVKIDCVELRGCIIHIVFNAKLNPKWIKSTDQLYLSENDLKSLWKRVVQKFATFFVPWPLRSYVPFCDPFETVNQIVVVYLPPFTSKCYKHFRKDGTSKIDRKKWLQPLSRFPLLIF